MFNIKNYKELTCLSFLSGSKINSPIYHQYVCHENFYVSIKPIVGTLISTNRKTRIIEKIKEYNVQSIDVVIVDPAYMYVIPSITIRYNPNETELSGSDIGSLVANKIISYELNNLNLFEKNFRFSKFLSYISSSNPSITGATSTIYVQRKFAPSIVIKNDYVLTYNQELRRLGDKKITDSLYGYVTSSEFTYKGNKCRFDDDGFGTLRTYYLDRTSSKRIYNGSIGEIDYITGIIRIRNFLPENIYGEISVSVRPVYEDITPIRNQILLMSDVTIRVVNDISNKLESTISSVNTIGLETSISAVTTNTLGEVIY
jgi:hypothetical protein